MITAKKSLGQNFLVNPHIIDRIVTAAEISSADTILEIGPGTGNLTKKLAEKAGKVIAIEKDQRLIEPLREDLKKYPNVEVIEADILKLDISKILNTQYLILNPDFKIVANIPYYITSTLLRTILESAGWRMAKPKLIVLTIQKEVAQRITARPPHMNLLALSVQYYADPEIILNISKNNFRPIPKVDSSIIKLLPIQGLRSKERGEGLFQLTRAGFSEKRKQLAPILSKKLKLPKEKVLGAFKKTGIATNARPENLSLGDWQILSSELFG